MHIFADNDIILKLSSLDLLDAISHLRKDANTDIACLSSLRYRLRKRPIEDEAAQERALTFVDSCTRIDQVYLRSLDVDLDVQDLLANRPNIDAGEAQLLSATLASPEGIFLTGDKRCLKALYQSSETALPTPYLQGKVIILEQLVLQAIKTNGFEKVKKRALKGIYCDTAIRASFGSGHAAEESNVTATLKSYIEEIETACPCILAPINSLMPPGPNEKP